MPDVKISALPSATTPLAGTEVLPIVQGGTTDQVSVANLTAGRSVAASGLAIDANSSGNAVRITQTGAGNALLVEDSASPDSSPFVIDSVGRVVSGFTNWEGEWYTTGTTPTFWVVGQAGASQGYGAVNYSGASTLLLTRSTGTNIGDRGAVASGDAIGVLTFAGDDAVSAGYIRSASITATVDGTVSTAIVPGRLTFSTSTSDTGVTTERMRIDSSGQVGIGQTSSAGYRVIIGGNLVNSVNARGLAVHSSVTASTNTAPRYFASSANTASNGGTPYTVANLYHYIAQQSTFNADSTVTNQYGFVADVTVVGATNNYGFYGNIAAGTGRYNFYAAGTAQNLFSGDVLVFGAGAIGYATGSGGAVTQATSRTTGVTLNKTNGAITLVSAAGTTAYQSFTVTNSTVAATDVIRVCQKSGTDKYIIAVTNVSAGSFEITFATTGGTTTEQPVFNFSVTKAVTS